VDLGVDDEGRRRCEVLAADLDEDGCPDGDCGHCESPGPGVGGCSYSGDGCLQGWYLDRASCEHGELRLTSPHLVARDSDLRFECREIIDP
jgi:hypothetical protein